MGTLPTARGVTQRLAVDSGVPRGAGAPRGVVWGSLGRAPGPAAGRIHRPGRLDCDPTVSVSARGKGVRLGEEESGPDCVRVLLVDDHPLMLDALRGRLEADGGMRVVGTASNARQALDRYGATQPDVVLCDVGLGRNQENGIDVTRQLLAAHPDARVLMFTGYEDQELVQEALAAGAVGYVVKRAPLPELISCINEAAAGEREVYDRQTYREMMGALRRPKPDTPPVRLTAREQAVLQLMARGVTTNKGIAQELKLSEASVSTYVNRVVHKMNVEGRAAAIAKAYREGMVDRDAKLRLRTGP